VVAVRLAAELEAYYDSCIVDLRQVARHVTDSCDGTVPATLVADW